jgi:cellulose synthase/poly-beta-1,6-N-acetylglucosamine synthase-like glycosyltransferase
MDSFTLQLAFWVACLAVFWTYFGYYAFLRAYSIFASKPVRTDNITPSVSLIIAAYNEENRIGDKLENSLLLDYPGDILEIIVVSDGSNDGTVEIVSAYKDKGIKLIEVPDRRGKHYAQERGVEQAVNDIVVFTDATTLLDTDALRKIVRGFSDPEVGCVSGMDRIDLGHTSRQGEDLYIRYEMKLRALESSVSSLIGVSGSFFAVRKSICDTWHTQLSSDFCIPIMAHLNGYRCVLDSEAIGSYGLVSEPEREFDRKVRTVVHGLDVLFHFRSILNPLKNGFYSLQMISHKLIRWMVPFLLIFCLILNFALASGATLYQIILALQLTFYLAALAAFLMEELRQNGLFRIPFFFTMANWSILVAWIEYIRGARYVTWERTSR